MPLNEMVERMEKQIIAHHVSNVTTGMTPEQMYRSPLGKKIIKFVYTEFADRTVTQDMYMDLDQNEKIHFGRMMCLGLWTMCRGIKNKPFIKVGDTGYDDWIDYSNGHILINCNTWYHKIEELMPLTARLR
tara:strand:+ start:55 stop:447 length:393 start_codon:yes stop_codon:yes gene_type:complete